MPELAVGGTPFASPRLRASQKEGLGSRGGAEARRDSGLDFCFCASDVGAAE